MPKLQFYYKFEVFIPENLFTGIQLDNIDPDTIYETLVRVREVIQPHFPFEIDIRKPDGLTGIFVCEHCQLEFNSHRALTGHLARCSAYNSETENKAFLRFHIVDKYKYISMESFDAEKHRWITRKLVSL